jgi:hypothetical protein
MAATPETCPKCKNLLEMGFGLAGGGYGPYLFCETCQEIVEKWPDPEFGDHVSGGTEKDIADPDEVKAALGNLKNEKI